MNVDQIITQLNQKYPGKNIIKNNDSNATEILCEIDPSSDHLDYSVAIAVIDHSIPHYHNQTEEIYEVIKGTLNLFIRHPELDSGSQLDYRVITLKPGNTYTIKPGTYHYAKGYEAWVKVTSHPGWTITDHLNLS